MNTVYKILIVEDDSDMAKLIQKLCNKWNFEASICTDFSNIVQFFEETTPHIVLMDITLPTFDGFYWCKKIRELSNVPIIFVSSRDSNMDLIMAVNNGADDYINKPFDSNVFIAKLQAIIRRTYEYKILDNQIMEYNGVILNLNDSTIHYLDKNIELTKNEVEILKILMLNVKKTVSRSSLMKTLWNDDIYVNENTLTVNINRLRKKLNLIDLENFINTKKGLGYIIL
ncbi:MAG: response regulator transcription factor [Clostridium perfringens]|nr:response regulator transcription factor [Clostridium perfringens]